VICRESLAFAAEPVFACVANVLNQHENLPQPIPEVIRNFKLYDVEIKYGLLQVINQHFQQSFVLIKL
jgi:SCY1-like protein 2